MALANEYDVLLELCRDLNTRHPNPLGILWYTAANKLYPTTTVEDIKQQALQPRLDHLNRTIARLQEELKAEAV
ncbi:hypothetical protein GR160_02990 [Flavobacterium sp. Sd200]|uniref:hypothetical protein n=1 Tax=Flavobacterium sp. Sd200 TaxID=2692211 RepID=UPI00136EA191|nr:hypothetical protein [Flavobacterium sp. Sd200]MXN90180.1 hypothetical protein [Flavobacterium sp. Sd200]